MQRNGREVLGSGRKLPQVDSCPTAQCLWAHTEHGCRVYPSDREFPCVSHQTVSDPAQPVTSSCFPLLPQDRFPMGVGGVLATLSCDGCSSAGWCGSVLSQTRTSPLPAAPLVQGGRLSCRDGHRPGTVSAGSMGGETLGSPAPSGPPYSEN